MSIILEVDSPDVDIGLTSVEHEESFVLLDTGVDETNAPQFQSEFSDIDSSFSESDIDLDDEIEDEENDTIQLDEHQVNQELEEVSTYVDRLTLKFKILVFTG
jgi:hypothetical protein